MKKLSIPMTRWEIFGGWFYLIFQLLILPTILYLCNILSGSPLSDAQINFIFFAINFICVTVIFNRFLISSVKQLFKEPFKCLRSAFTGFILYYVSSYVVNIAIFLMMPEFSNVNDNSIADMTKNNFALMSIGTVALVPVAEELFYRGLIFRPLYDRNKAVAYIVSSLVFSAVHILGYIGSVDHITLLLCFLQYIPAGICLGWAYIKSDSIIAPILIHITVNFIGICAMR